MINIVYAALSMRAQTEKATFSCKDDRTLTKHTRRWTYSALRYFYVRFQDPKYEFTKNNVEDFLDSCLFFCSDQKEKQRGQK